MSKYSAANTHLIFVYGTMMTGLINHPRIARGIVNAYGESLTVRNDFCMMTRRSAQSVIVPAVIEAGQYEKARVYGEVYRITGPTLEIVDKAEGHPYVYQREQIEVTGFKPLCWMYQYAAPDLDDLIDEKGRPNQKYVIKYDDGLGGRVHRYAPPRGTTEYPG